jgi:hypothetical protein
MRRLITTLALLHLCAGCTHLALERKTVNQASTLSDLQYQQVLDNLAMFACNPDSMPWHLKLNGAVVQVTDQATGMFGAVFGGSVSATFSPTVNGQRGVVGQWNALPTVDPDDLEPLQLAYLKAIRPVDADGKIRDKIYDQVCEMSVKYNIVLDKDTLLELVEHTKKEIDKKAKTERVKDLFDKLDKQFNALVDASDPTTIKEIRTAKSKHPLGPFLTDEAIEESLDNRKKEKLFLITQYRVGVEDQIVRLTRDLCDLPYIPRYPVTGRPEHSPYLVSQIQDKIKSLIELAKEPKFASPWVCIGSKKDVPKCACHVGHYCHCGCDRYVWVMPEQLAILRDFTIAVLNLTPLETQQIPAFFPGGGVSFSPTTSAGVR